MTHFTNDQCLKIVRTYDQNARLHFAYLTHYLSTNFERFNQAINALLE